MVLVRRITLLEIVYEQLESSDEVIVRSFYREVVDGPQLDLPLDRLHLDQLTTTRLTACHQD